jgi:hypothetical protein
MNQSAPGPVLGRLFEYGRISDSQGSVLYAFPHARDHDSLLPPLIRLHNPSYVFTSPLPYSSTAHLLLDGMPDLNKLPNALRDVSFRQIQVKDVLLFTLVR